MHLFFPWTRISGKPSYPVVCHLRNVNSNRIKWRLRLGFVFCNDAQYYRHIRVEVMRVHSERVIILPSYHFHSLLSHFWNTDIKTNSDVLKLFCQLWSGAPKYLINLLDSVQRSVVRMIDEERLPSLIHRRNVGMPSLFVQVLQRSEFY